jgi:hypothetical protein
LGNCRLETSIPCWLWSMARAHPSATSGLDQLGDIDEDGNRTVGGKDGREDEREEESDDESKDTDSSHSDDGSNFSVEDEGRDGV